MILELNEPTRSVFVKTMTDNEWVVSDPAPTAHVVNVTIAGVDMVAWCWVENADWFAARTDLWLKLVERFETDDRICMSLPQQEVITYQKNGTDTAENTSGGLYT